MSGILMMSVGNSYGSLPVNTVAPVVSGTATVGQTLSTTDGTWTGAPAPTFTYQWQRAGSNIGGATSTTYVLVDADAGNTVRCVVTATNALGAVSANSNNTAAVNQIPANTVAPVVSGTAQVPNVLSTTNGTWTGTPAPTFTYQWQRNTTNIGGATASTYTLQAADVGNTVRCVVTGTNSAGSASANSNSTATIAAAPTFLDVSTTGSPEITTSGNYRFARFTGSGTFVVNSVGSGSSESNTIQFFSLGGGGSTSQSGTNGSGGGGGGGIRENATNDFVVTAQTYTVGVAGAGGTSGLAAAGFGISVTQAGQGGSGGTSSSGGGGSQGGSGGGGGIAANPGTTTSGGSGATGTPPGFAGGTGNSAVVGKSAGGGGGGGGGPGGVGGAGSFTVGGNGGPGRVTTIRGFSETFGGGGGGAGYSGGFAGASGGSGGSGGGGTGASFSGGGSTSAPSGGAANSGGGAGGTNSTFNARSGGSGIVIIRWRFQ